MTEPTTSRRDNYPDAAAQRQADRATDTSASGADVPAPETWATGEEPPTERQERYLGTLAREAGEDLPEGLTKAEASEKIDELRDKTGRSG